MPYTENPETRIDVVTRLFERFRDTGIVNYQEQESIYGQIALRFKEKTVVDIGCGHGSGTGIISLKNWVHGVDKYEEHVKFARGLYPWCSFEVWDIAKKPYHQCNIAVAVDVIEHIADYRQALKNMILSASEELWLSTPNRLNPGIGGDKPHNSLHVREWTPEEFIGMAKDVANVSVSCHNYFDLGTVRPDSKITPMVYRVMV